MDFLEASFTVEPIKKVTQINQISYVVRYGALAMLSSGR